MQTKEWNTKKEILETYPISSATYKKRIKNIDQSKTKFITSKSGSPTRLIHHSILDELFRKRRRLSTKEYKQTIKTRSRTFVYPRVSAYTTREASRTEWNRINGYVWWASRWDTHEAVNVQLEKRVEHSGT